MTKEYNFVSRNVSVHNFIILQLKFVKTVIIFVKLVMELIIRNVTPAFLIMKQSISLLVKKNVNLMK